MKMTLPYRKYRGVIRPEYYYVWCYRPKKYWKYLNQQKQRLYKKHYCGTPFYTRFMARRTLEMFFGDDSRKELHVIRGKELIRKVGTKSFYGIPLYPRYRISHIYFKNELRWVPRYIIPIEGLGHHDQLNRYKYKLLEMSKTCSRIEFNRFYAIMTYGFLEGLDSKYQKDKRHKFYQSILSQI